jgi:hypothetical protein
LDLLFMHGDATVYVHVIAVLFTHGCVLFMGMAGTVQDMVTSTVHVHSIDTVHEHGVWTLFNMNSDMSHGIRVA